MHLNKSLSYWPFNAIFLIKNVLCGLKKEYIPAFDLAA